MKKHEHLVWTEESCRKVLDSPIFGLFECIRTAAGGKKGTFSVVEAPDWVTVVPVLKDASGTDQFLMVRQFRHGSRSLTLEFPAGVIDPGETPRQAAVRELQEETGYSSGRLVYAASVNPNPAFMANRTHTFLAYDLEKISGQNLDENELLEFEIHSAEEIRRNMGSKELNSAIMVQALYWYDHALAVREGNP